MDDISLATVNPDWFTCLERAYPGSPRQRVVKWVHIGCLQVSNGAGRLFHRPVDLDLQIGPSAIPDEIPVNTGYLMRICEISW